MQVSAVLTIQTAVFLHYSTNQQAQSWMWSHETRYLNLFQYFEVNDTFLWPVFLPISLVFWWAQTNSKFQRTVQMLLTILGKETDCQMANEEGSWHGIMMASEGPLVRGNNWKSQKCITIGLAGWNGWKLLKPFLPGVLLIAISNSPWNTLSDLF